MEDRSFVRVEMLLDAEHHEIVCSTVDPGLFLGAEQNDTQLVMWMDTSDPEAILDILHRSMRQYGIDAVIVGLEVVPFQDWQARWIESQVPLRVGKQLVILPYADSIPLSPTDIPIVIEPKMAFGTGHHATTRLSLELLEDVIRPEQRWVDIGTGTGILAIAAAKLGATRVIALDYDQWSVDSACENIRINGCSDRISVHLADALTFLYPTADGIVANMHHTFLSDFAQRCIPALRNVSVIVCSGILYDQAEDITSVYERCGFNLRKCLSQEEWVALLLQRDR